MSRVSEVVGFVVGAHIAGGVAVLLIGAVALDRFAACVRQAAAQPCGCMRVTSRGLGTVSETWGPTARAGLTAQAITMTKVCKALHVSRQYVDRLLDGMSATIPIEHFESISRMAGIDPAEHFTPSTTSTIQPWQSHRNPTSPNSAPG